MKFEAVTSECLVKKNHLQEQTVAEAFWSELMTQDSLHLSSEVCVELIWTIPSFTSNIWFVSGEEEL